LNINKDPELEDMEDPNNYPYLPHEEYEEFVAFCV
jgi:hypothetical protein